MAHFGTLLAQEQLIFVAHFLRSIDFTGGFGGNRTPDQLIKRYTPHLAKVPINQYKQQFNSFKLYLFFIDFSLAINLFWHTLAQ
jgi:hypothetical protein